jgi:aspartyl-tRNA(Asn)/glutamyl-tRNA(Gln) amidotransferase subunit C
VRYEPAVAITRDEVRRVAALARLRLEPAEEERLTADLDHILEAFARLRTLDTTGVEPARALAEPATPLRDDAVTNAEATDELLANAPAPDGRYFRVPKIIE